MDENDRLALYALLAVHCGFTPDQVDRLSVEQSQAILEIIEAQNKHE